ncbi:hypothetical protein [Luteibacter sp. Lutesp34]|uniref:hypothetical protein n=1 Tax=Luteibacter sp. Lutesp34 TaxID=3243030 RepID=UPI0039B48A30
MSSVAISYELPTWPFDMTQNDRVTSEERIVLAVGAYVIQAQELEHLLKFLLPMTDEADPSLKAVIGRSAALSKKPMGVVAQAFVKSCPGDIAALQEHFAKIISDRNEIVHHFSARFGPLLNAKQFEEILREFKRRHRQVKDLIQTLRPMALKVVEVLRDGPYAGTDQYEEFARVFLALQSRWLSSKKCGGA